MAIFPAINVWAILKERIEAPPQMNPFAKANGAQRFLRGASTSGNTDGSDTMNLGGEITVDANLDANTTNAASARNRT